MAIPGQKIKSALGRHRLLSPTASVHVSPLCLGGMGFGNKAKYMGDTTKSGTFELLDYFYDQGGNFVDTANYYQQGESEEWIGEWMELRGVRDELVISTKYTMNLKQGQPVIQSNFAGTGTKSMYASVEQSLKSLRTAYIDILFVHMWDFRTSIPELMQSLNLLVQQRKVLYLGISDTPAWVVSKANEYARQNNLRPFCIYQGAYGAHNRDLERDVIPMCRDENMALHAFGIMGSGNLKLPNSETEKSDRNTPFLHNGKEPQVAQVLDKIAKAHAVPLTSVALAYVMQKAPYVFPLLGGRKIKYLKANIAALSLELSPSEVAEIEKGYDFDFGYPHKYLNMSGGMADGPEHFTLFNSLGFDYVQPVRPIKPRK